MKVQYSLNSKQFKKYESFMLFGPNQGKVVATPKETNMEKIVVEFDLSGMLFKEAMDLTVGVTGEIVIP